MRVEGHSFTQGSDDSELGMFHARSHEKHEVFMSSFSKRSYLKFIKRNVAQTTTSYNYYIYVVKFITSCLKLSNAAGSSRL